MSVPDPNAALAEDLFSQADMSTGFSSDLIENGEYTLALSARFNKKDGGYIFVEGKVQAGPEAGKNVKVFSVVLDSNTTKRGNQKGVSLTNLAAIGLGPEELNAVARQVGATAANLEPLYTAVTVMIEGRIVQAHLVQNTYKGKNGETTDMQASIGKLSLVGAPPVAAIGGAPALPAPAPAAAAPAPAAAAPAPAPLPPGAAEAPAPAALPAPAVLPPPAVVPPVAPAPLALAPEPAAAAAPTIEELTAALALAQAQAAAQAPAAAPVAGTVVVAPEPTF